MIAEDIKVYGGFAGFETDSAERDPDAHVVTLSGEIQGDANTSNNSYHVVLIEDPDELGIMPQLDGVTITEGNANGLLANLENFGGGILVYKSSAVISNVILDENESDASDGGGAGCHVEGCNTLFECPGDPDEIWFVNCVLGNNDSANRAGGLCNNQGEVHVVNCVFHDNTAFRGGGIYFTGAGAMDVDSSTFVGNDATAGTNGGGGLNAVGAVIENAILWGNTAASGTTEEQQLLIGTGSIEHSCIEGLNIWSGNDNIGTDPLFFNAAADEYWLQSISPCIDTGDATLLTEVDISDLDRDVDIAEVTPLDLKLRTRVLDGSGGASPEIDMGAFEKGFCPADLNDDDSVDVGDLLILLANWDACPAPCPPYCTGDINEDCTVDTQDLLILLASWDYCTAEFGESPPANVVDCLNKYTDPTEITKCIEAMMLIGNN